MVSNLSEWTIEQIESHIEKMTMYLHSRRLEEAEKSLRFIEDDRFKKFIIRAEEMIYHSKLASLKVYHKRKISTVTRSIVYTFFRDKDGKSSSIEMSLENETYSLSSLKLHLSYLEYSGQL